MPHDAGRRGIGADRAVASSRRRHRNIATCSTTAWGLDRTTSAASVGPRTHPEEARAERIVIDTGATDHPSSPAAPRRADFVDDDNDGDPNDIGNDDADAARPDGVDCHGHGTHVAATAVGDSYGIAKEATLWGLRVLNCEGSAPWSAIIAAIDWVTANHRTPAVVNMSIQGGASDAVDHAVRRSLRRV